MKEKRPKRAELDVKYILKTYWSFLKKQKLLLTTVVLIILIITAFGYTTRFLFKTIVDKGTLLAAKEITTSQFLIVVSVIVLIWLSIIGVSAIFRWFRVHTLNLLEARIMLNLKQYYYNHILQLSHKFHTTHKTGSLIARLGRGSNAMERITDFLVFQVFPLIFELLLVGITLVTIDKKIGLIVVIVGTIFVIYSAKLQKIQRKLTVLTNAAEDREKAIVGDTFTNIDSIKYYGKEKLIGQRYKGVSETTNKLLLKQWHVYRWISSGESIIVASGGLLVLYFALKGFVAGIITLGTVTFAWTLYNSLIDSIARFMDGLRGYHRSIADFHDLFQYGKIENEIKDKPNAQNLEVKDGTIEFKNVSFKYHERSFFNNFSLVVPKNKKVALVGHSGSGKSTLVKLLYRLYDLEKGEIKVDNTNISDIKQESLRSEMSIVPQECVLFDDTIYNNILFSNPKASRSEVLKAIKFAQLDKVIANFPYRENTIVGERGVKLSGGEKQRVSIARAILANKKILVLDEATSSLDSKTEHEIQKDLYNLMQGRTSLIIAHRLSTIMHADLIVVLDKGKIVQQGTHNQLINKPGTYRELWNLQKGGYIN